MNQNDNGSAAEKAAEKNKDPAFAFVLKFCPKLLESKKTDDKYQIAKKITHLYLNNKNIYRIVSMPLHFTSFGSIETDTVSQWVSMRGLRQTSTHQRLKRNIDRITFKL